MLSVARCARRLVSKVAGSNPGWNFSKNKNILVAILPLLVDYLVPEPISLAISNVRIVGEMFQLQESRDNDIDGPQQYWRT